MKVSEAAKRAIVLAEAIRNYWDAELPKRHPNYPWIRSGEDSGPPPPEEKKLRELFSRLPEDTVYKLVLIAYLGRGDFGTKELSHQYETLKATFEKPAVAASQILGKGPVLGEYLAEGLEELEKSGIDVDNLTLAVEAQK